MRILMKVPGILQTRIAQILTFIAWIVVLNLAIHFWKNDLEKNRQQNLLQRQKVVSSGDAPPRYDLSTGESTANYLQFVPNALQQRLIILCGMSQMYAINDQKDEDQTISEWMDDLLRPSGSSVFGLAAPNICNEEVLLLLLTLINKPITKPAVFMYGLCFDKFRNVDLRLSYRALLRSEPDLIEKWEFFANEYRDKYPKAADKMISTIRSLGEEKKKANNSFEIYIRRHLSYLIPIIGARGDLNAWFQLKLYLLRNKIFKIKPTSKRPQIPSRYQMNKEFLELFLDVAKEHGVIPIIYIVPLNPQADNPYVSNEYESFKAWIKALCEELHIPFDNLESVVPHEDWGEFLGGPDFKHFRGAGHRRTAEELVRRFRSFLLPN
jgi:hypothetical protein